MELIIVICGFILLGLIAYIIACVLNEDIHFLQPKIYIYSSDWYNLPNIRKVSVMTDKNGVRYCHEFTYPNLGKSKVNDDGTLSKYDNYSNPHGYYNRWSEKYPVRD